MVLVSLFVRPIVRSISYFFGLAKKNCPVSETWQFFVHPFEFFVQSFLKIGHSLISRLEKNEESEQNMNCPVSETAQFFFWPNKKIEIDRTIGRPRD